MGKMKIVLALMALTLVPQNAEASIFDSFKQAMSSITTSVEKMITSVAYDVKETIDCTLLALEHSLSITLFKEYNKKCKGIDNPDSNINENLLEAVHTVSGHVNEDFHESNAKIKMKRICGIPEDELDLDKIRKVLLHNSGRLRILDSFLRKQLDILPQNLKTLNGILYKDTGCSVEEVLVKIKALIDMVKKVQDQTVGDEIGDVLKEMLQLLNGDDPIGAPEKTYLQSGLSNSATVIRPANNLVVIEPKIKEANDFDSLSSYEAPLVKVNAQTEPTFEYEDSQDMSIAEDADTDFVNIDTDINERVENVEPMATEVIQINSDNDEVDDVESTVEYVMAENDNSEDVEDSSDDLQRRAEDDVVDYPLFSGFNNPMNSEESEDSEFPDDDVMRKITEIMRDQPHTELVMGNFRN